ncbi:MAG: sugar transferase [Clostridia bacterium]|nr:sugar transferase [Clostridia bacterium]
MENISENKPDEGIKDNIQAESAAPESESNAFENSSKEIDLAQEVVNKVNEKVGVTEEELQEDRGETVEKEVYPSYRKKGFRYGCYLFFKRSFDIITSFLVLLVFSWLYLILTFAVFVNDGGKPVYKQKRVGKNGKTIYLPKFRSMVKDANNFEKYLTPEQMEQYRTEYKIDNDPRITKIGKFLRKTSLDELPNIWAIFTGKISVVGPRPLIQEEIDEKYGKDGAKLLSVKPGLIGWWAVNGRSNTTYTSGERQALELYYVDHCSFGLDTKIFFKAIGKVFKRDGAK